MVCVELLTAVKKRSLTPGTETHIQENNSSFGWVWLQCKLKDLVSPLPPSTYKPANGMYIMRQLIIMLMCRVSMHLALFYGVYMYVHDRRRR